MTPLKTSEEFEYEIKDAGESHLDSIKSIYKENFKSKPKDNYFKEFLNVKESPFLVAVDKYNEVIGYIACKINDSKTKLYVASISVISKYANDTIEKNLIKVVGDYTKSNKFKYIGTHIRGPNTKLRLIFVDNGFYEKLEGRFKNGDDKYLYMKELIYTTLPDDSTKYKVTRKEPEPFVWGYFTAMKPKIKLPEPKKGYFEIIDKIKYADISNITLLHNKYMGKERDNGYFYKIYRDSDNPLYVAKDSNGTIIAYLAARVQSKPIYIVEKGKRIMTQKVGGIRNRINFISMAVTEEWRGLGIAKELIYELFKYANANKKIEVIFGHVRGDNKNAIKLYAKLGFKLTVVGYYEDTKELKYQIYKRIRLPDIKHFLKKHTPKAAYTAYFVLLHELLHSFRKYEDWYLP